MASWTKDHEELEAELIRETLDYLSQHDADNIKRAAAHAKTGLKTKFKETLKDLTLGVIPGVSLARNLTHSLDAMLKSSFGGAMLNTYSVEDHRSEETAPHNYLSNLFSKVLRKNASREEKMLFVRHFVGTYSMAAGAVGGIGIGGVAGEHIGEAAAKGVEFVFEKGLDAAGDLVTPEVFDVVTTDVTKKDLIKGIRVGPVAWAVYLSGKPRHANAPTSKVENCRLALRVILGLPHDKTQLADGARWKTHPERNHPVVSPRDTCELLADAHGKNAMINGDVTKGFSRIASYSEFGKVDESYTDFGSTRGREWVKSHITYLQFILVGLGLQRCLENDVFVLT